MLGFNWKGYLFKAKSQGLQSLFMAVLSRHRSFSLFPESSPSILTTCNVISSQLLSYSKRQRNPIRAQTELDSSHEMLSWNLWQRYGSIWAITAMASPFKCIYQKTTLNFVLWHLPLNIVYMHKGSLNLLYGFHLCTAPVSVPKKLHCTVFPDQGVQPVIGWVTSRRDYQSHCRLLLSCQAFRWE